MSDLADIPRGKGRGTWQPILFHTPEPEYRGFWSAIVFCPECNKPLSAVNHNITSDGQVTPSLGHPNSYPPCDWHPPSVKLIGWEQWPVPETQIYTCARCSVTSHNLGGWGTWSGDGDICSKCSKELREGQQP